MKKLIGIITSCILIAIFLSLEIMYQCGIINQLDTLWNVLISISTSSLFYFIGMKTSNDSFSNILSRRYIYNFQLIKEQLDEKRQKLLNHYYREYQLSSENPNFNQLILENNYYIFDGLHEQSMNLYNDINKGQIDIKGLRKHLTNILTNIIKPYKEALSNARKEDYPGSYYSFYYLIQIMKKLNNR